MPVLLTHHQSCLQSRTTFLSSNILVFLGKINYANYATRPVCILLISYELTPLELKYQVLLISIISLAGFLGMLLDSLLGAAFQLKFQNPETGEFSDIVSLENTNPIGISWMTNDIVNLVSNLIGTAIFAIFLLF